MSEAKIILELNGLWDRADGNVIADNVEALLSKSGYKTLSAKMEALMNATGSTKHAVYAWLNHGRRDVKIPFLKLCAIASEFDADIKELLKGEAKVNTKKSIASLCKKKSRVYVYFATKELGIDFLERAEAEGLTFTDGAKPTSRNCAEIMAVDHDNTINFVGTAGRIAYGSGINKIDDEKLIKVDYQKWITK